MIPADWIAVIEALTIDKKRFPKEESYLLNTKPVLQRTIPSVRMAVPPLASPIPWYLFKSFYIARTRFRDLQGRVNVVIEDEGHAAYFVHLLSAYLELAERTLHGSSALALSANERASWGTDFSPPAVHHSYLLLWDADELFSDYKHVAGLVSVLDRVDDAKQGVIVISRTPINPRKTLQSKSGEQITLDRLRLRRIDIYGTMREYHAK